MTAAEAKPVGALRDVRGTPEERLRFAALIRDAPYLAPYITSLA